VHGLPREPSKTDGILECSGPIVSPILESPTDWLTVLGNEESSLITTDMERLSRVSRTCTETQARQDEFGTTDMESESYESYRYRDSSATG
jgi:hypothetical protein